MQKLIISLLLVTLSLQLFSQKDPLKWKKLTKDELELKVYNDDPNIPAVIFYDYGQMYFDLNPNGDNLFLFRKRHVRMKILNKEGLKYAKVKFVYNDKNCEYYSGELSFSLKAATYNIQDNGKYKTSRVKYKNIIHKDSSGCIKIAEFEFPNVKVGSILEYVITIPTLKLIKPDTWFFQNELPVIHSEFRARIPHEFNYIFSVKNVKDLPEKDSSYYDKVINYRYNYNRRSYNSVINMSGMEYRFVNKYVPSLINKGDAEKINIHLQYIKSKPNDYAWQRISKALMITTLYSYDRRSPNQRQMLNYPAGYIIYYLPTWEELNQNLLVDEKFGLAVVKYWDCDSISNSILTPNQTEFQKTVAIYNFVKSNMKWNKKYDLYADVSDNVLKKLYSKTGAKINLNTVGNFFAKGEGTSSEINFVLMYLLNNAKIEVHPVLVNLNGREQIDDNIPDINQFKSVIALVKVNGKEFLLDAASPESKLNKISEKYDKTQMFVVRKENYGWLEEK